MIAIGTCQYLEVSAAISADGLYRYNLSRAWGGGKPLCFVMLNPSTANGAEDDPTIRKCVGFARRLGYWGISVVNLFAFRSTDPKGLRGVVDPIGPESDEWIRSEVSKAALVIAAWGQLPPTPPWLRERARTVLTRVAREAEVFALDVTHSGQPRHPLMLPYSCRPFRYREKWA